MIPEPTDLRIGIAHKGFSCAEITVHGRAAHGSRPLDGRDAIMRMGRVLARLEALDASLQAGRSHPLLEPKARAWSEAEPRDSSRP